MNLARCQRSHGLRFEPRTVANRAVFKAQNHADWTLSMILSPDSVVLCFELGSVRSRSGFKAQPMRALVGGLFVGVLDFLLCRTENLLSL